MNDKQLKQHEKVHVYVFVHACGSRGFSFKDYLCLYKSQIKELYTYR
jgi:hypothetical protein